MRRRLFFVLAAAVVLAAWPLRAWQNEQIPTSSEIASTLKELSAITGFRVRRQLPFELVTRAQVNEFLKERIRRTVKPEEIRAEEITLKMFGFVPPEFDLRKTTIDLLTEQAAAFYDYDHKKLFISDWASKNMREAALIHELAHALADQNFRIARFLRGARKSGEESAAREAVVEGQASWLMIEVAARRAGTSLKDPAIAKQYIQDPSGEQGGDYPVFDKVPLYLQRTLIFPYDDGMRFQQAVFLRDEGRAFAELFRQPPTSTAQVLHPQAYFSRVPFLTPALPKPAKNSKPYTEGTLGELEMSVLLEQYGSKDTAGWLSPKLKGAAYRIDETKPEKHMTLVFNSEWSDEDAAKAFFNAYRGVVSKKYRRAEISYAEPDYFTGRSEDGYFEVARNGAFIRSGERFIKAFDALMPGVLRQSAWREPAASRPWGGSDRPGSLVFAGR